MATLFIDPGLLRKRARLEVGEAVEDGSGGAATAWREVAELSVHIEPVSVVSRERFGQREAEITHRVICRHRGDVERGTAFAIGARRLLVRTVHDPDESGRFLICRCEEAQ